MAPLMQSLKYPIRVAGPRHMIAAGIVAESHATIFRVDETFAHAAHSSIRQVDKSLCSRRFGKDR